ncbi:MAG: D-alanyl-D-alanine carboxypeptidase family protein [Oscillospiraceae bacterium]|nr:D-alanyl-D-alanine carboxypeptidase family protein [Oscillospiraceae bacterium]
MTSKVSKALALAVLALTSLSACAKPIPTQGSGNNSSLTSENSSDVSVGTSESDTSDTSQVESSELIIGEDDTLCINEGEVYEIAEGKQLILRGGLDVLEGGTLIVNGDMYIENGSCLDCYGNVEITEKGTVSLDGNLLVEESGVINGDGCIKVNDLFSDILCYGTVTAKLTAPQPVEKDGVTYVGGVLLVNKEYALPKTYGDGIDPTTYDAYLEMKDSSGYPMSIVSGYRSYEKQESTFNYWCSIDSYENALTYSALPGHSEHQTGLAMDITSLEESYADTAEGQWLAENCYKYGFIIRYPEDKTDITGYIYEPWHVRYLGKSTAKLVFDSGLSLEEFLGVA